MLLLASEPRVWVLRSTAACKMNQKQRLVANIMIVLSIAMLILVVLAICYSGTALGHQFLQFLLVGVILYTVGIVVFVELD